MSAVNIDPANAPYGHPDLDSAPPKGSSFGMDKISGIRVVSRNSDGVPGWLDYYKDIGRYVMAIVTEQSGGYVYPRADYVQIGNEPDLPGTAMTPQDYANYWNLYRDTYDGAFSRFVLAGLGSGLGNSGPYLSQVLPLLNKKPDWVAVHCYDGDTNQSAAEIDDLWNRSQIPVVVTEWNKASSQIWDMLGMLNGPGGRSTLWNSYYPYTTAMNPTTAGLVDANGNPTSSGASFVSAPSV